MANHDNIVELNIDTAGLVVGFKAVETVLTGLGKVLSDIGQALKDAFSIQGYTDYKNTVKRFGKALADELLVLQLNLGRMKAAIADAVAPIASVFVPWLNGAVRAVTDFAHTVGSFLRALLVGASGNEALAQSAQNAAAAEGELEAAATSAGKAARRSLMNFDQIQRLNASSGSGSSTTAAWGQYVEDPVSPQIQAIADRVLALLAPLRALDFSGLLAGLQQVWAAFESLARVAGSALEWLWYEVITPFIGWLVEVFGPVFTQVWAAGLTLAAAVLEPLIAGLQNLMLTLEPVVAYIGQTVIGVLGYWQEAYEELAAAITQKSSQITGILTNIGTVLTAVWNVVGPVLTALREQFGSTFETIGYYAGLVATAILQSLYAVSEYLAGAFTGDWKRSWEAIKTFLAGIVNLIIGLLNAMLSRLGAALNSVVKAANKVRFTVPDWVPGLGGASLGIHMNYVTVPQIPYLARGAVLPANKPFLAMVGDQKHGTNVEAPLATIQEAVAGVMQDQTAAILAGFEASVGVQREILEAVLGIRIGDEVIGAAVQRYERKQAVLLGGVV